MVKRLDPSKCSVIIVGAGTWGASTALHLARRGYQSITVLDACESPSAISAGNDINKIARGHSRKTGHHEQDEDNDSWASEEVRMQAIEAWKKDPVYAGLYHETGYVIAASSPDVIRRLRETDRPTRDRGFEELNDANAFRSTMPEGVLTGDFPNWKGWYNPTGSGWVAARKALVATMTEAKSLGATFICGDRHGRVTRLIIGDEGAIRGVQTADGKDQFADRTILCAGANAGLFLDMEDQLRPTAWTLAHIKMTSEEAKIYRNLPVLFNVERGFFMEPDSDNHEMKICDEHPGYCNFTTDPLTGRLASVPFARHQIPKISEQSIRAFLQETMPHLAERPFNFARICWCADTPNRAFLISAHPEHPGLTLAVGGSGHGFMQIPVIGKYIADCMEEKLDKRMVRSWKWRPETAINRDWWDTQGRYGGKGVIINFQDIAPDEWTEIAYNDP